MKTIRQINIKNPPHYFFNDMINIKNFDPSLLNIDKISFKSTDDVIYHIEYITVKFWIMKILIVQIPFIFFKKKQTSKTRALAKLGKMFFILLQKLFLFSRKSNFRIPHFEISLHHQMPKHKTRNTFH